VICFPFTFATANFNKMKYLMLLSLPFLMMACNNADRQMENHEGHNADSVRKSALTDSANFSEIQWLDSTHQDLGKVTAGQVVEIVWRLKNVGNKPLVIADASPGCGCTVAEKPEEPIAPGGEGRIKAKFDSKGQPVGGHQKSVTVTANTKTQAYYLNFNVDIVDNK
jgi:hypothetical protein